MKTLGAILQTKRQARHLSLAQIEYNTKIKQRFLVALEANAWTDLPEYPIIAGFVKLIAGYLELDEKMVLAMLRRDYPPTMRLSLASNVRKNSFWRNIQLDARKVFIVMVVLLISLLGTYLAYQYYRFNMPPKIQIDSPVDGYIYQTNEPVYVSGTTEKDASVTVNNQPVFVDEEGRFFGQIKFEQSGKLVISSITRRGKSTTLEKQIVVK